MSKSSTSYIRSSSHSLKFTNQDKLKDINLLLYEYRLILQLVIDNLWEFGLKVETEKKTLILNVNKNKLECPSYLPNDYLISFKPCTDFSQRLLQCLGKQACSMIRASIKKRSKQLYKLKELQRERKDTRLLQRKIDTQSLVKPNAYRANIELDSRFFNLNQNSKHFDTFCRVYQLGNGLSFNLPIKHTKVSRKWLEKGKYKQAIRINEKNLVLIYEVPKELKKTGKTIGCDQGQNTVASFSDNQVTKCCTHNHDLNSIQDKLSRCKKGSKGFKRTQDHRKNYINHSLNQVDYSDIKELRLEKVKNIRRNKKSSRKLTHWKYPLIKQKLNRLGEEKGFLFVEVPNEFRSQRCSECGWVRKANRKGKTFTCTKCGFTTDSDLNASYNLELDLFEIPYWVRLKKMNRKGFYWNSDGLFLDSWECIVPNTKEGNGVE